MGLWGGRVKSTQIGLNAYLRRNGLAFFEKKGVDAVLFSCRGGGWVGPYSARILARTRAKLAGGIQTAT